MLLLLFTIMFVNKSVSVPIENRYLTIAKKYWPLHLTLKRATKSIPPKQQNSISARSMINSNLELLFDTNKFWVSLTTLKETPTASSLFSKIERGMLFFNLHSNFLAFSLFLSLSLDPFNLVFGLAIKIAAEFYKQIAFYRGEPHAANFFHIPTRLTQSRSYKKIL